MFLKITNDSPIYIQIADAVKENILKGVFTADEAIPSTTEISLQYKINPATVGKGFNLLVDEGIIYKKRGIGMFVAEGARERLMEKRKESFYKDYIISLIEEAEKLDISIDDIVTMIKKEK